jgi:oligopeptide/dipeptide ABC transporter ATP-binding protein
VDEVSLKIHEQECVALVGESGSGKTTFARLILRLTLPDDGEVVFRGRAVSSLTSSELRDFRLAVQPIFQDPGATFNPIRNVRRALGQALRQARVSRSVLERDTIELLTQVRLTPPEHFLGRYPHELSGGQRQRVAIARALALGPALIVADEPLSGADASIRGQILNLLSDLKRDRQMAFLLITHDISLARSFAQRVAVMYRGRIVEEGTPDAVLSEPKHPYTQLLLASAPTVDGGLDLERGRSSTTRDSAGAACPFFGRCPHAQDVCRERDPELRNVGAAHLAACHFAETYRAASHGDRLSKGESGESVINAP